jgi:MFS family permease
MSELRNDRYKWIALSNTTLGVLMASINSSIVLISLPAIFRGINIDPLMPENVGYLLWMLMGYMVVIAVLVVSLGRVGDMFGRVKMYNLGFAIFTAASIGLSFVFWQGASAAMTLIGLRIVQGIGGAFLMANSAAILTDAFPTNQRGMALGINSVAGISGSFIGLVVGGLLSFGDWHLIFLVTVPIGIAGTIWAYMSLKEIGAVKKARIDWWGNLSFGLGLISVLVGITYGIQPYGTSGMGWGNPMVLATIFGGIALLVVFCLVEIRVKDPMFRLGLFRVPAFSAGNLAGFLASTGRGGLMFMLIIWLQGIWLPYHGYSFESTPFWAAIYMLPMTAGFLVAGPLSGYLSDRFGARPFATGGMIAAAITFVLMALLPPDFSYAPFGLLLFANGLAMGCFASPNTAGIMNSVPPGERGVASGMRATFQNAAMNLSIGLFFSLMIAGLSATLPAALFKGLTAQEVPDAVADRIAHLPAVGSLFAAFLGYNPMKSLLGPALAGLPQTRADFLTGKTFFPDLISGPFMHGMRITFVFSCAMMLVAAGASWLRGKRYVYGEDGEEA